jgi:hypothetical protein
LLTERCITRDDGFSDPKARHFIGDDFFGVRQRAGQLSPQSNQQRAEVFRSLSDVGVVISNHGESRLMGVGLVRHCAIACDHVAADVWLFCGRLNSKCRVELNLLECDLRCVNLANTIDDNRLSCAEIFKLRISSTKVERDGYIF